MLSKKFWKTCQAALKKHGSSLDPKIAAAFLDSTQGVVTAPCWGDMLWIYILQHPPTRWAPNGVTSSPINGLIHKWVTGVITSISGVTALFITNFHVHRPQVSPFLRFLVFTKKFLPKMVWYGCLTGVGFPLHKLYTP